MEKTPLLMKQHKPKPKNLRTISYPKFKKLWIKLHLLSLKIISQLKLQKMLKYRKFQKIKKNQKNNRNNKLIQKFMKKGQCNKKNLEKRKISHKMTKRSMHK